MTDQAPNCPSRRTVLGGLGTAALIATTGRQAFAQQSFPSRPIRIIVPFAPGAINDTLARTIAERLALSVNQPVIVENRPGGNATIGTRVAAAAEPDGYTLLLISAAHAITAALAPELPYDSIRDFDFITLVARAPFLLIVNKDVPATSVQAFIAAAKRQPEAYAFASAGNGSSAHLLGELLNTMAGTQLLHVPYKGTTPALNDVIAGQVQCTFSTYTGALGAIQSGRVRALAVTSAKRTAVFPEIPSIAEAGYPDYDVSGWWGFLAPAGVPPTIVAALNQELNKVLQQASLRAKLAKDAVEALGSTPAELRAHVEKEIAQYRQIIVRAGVKPE